MANPHFMRIPRQADKAIISLFREVGKLHNLDTISVNPGFADQIAVATDGSESEELKSLLAHDASII